MQCNACRPTEKQYIVNELVGFTTTSFEVALLPLSFVSIFKGLRGISSFLIVVQYLMYRTSVDPIMAVCSVSMIHL